MSKRAKHKVVVKACLKEKNLTDAIRIISIEINVENGHHY